MACNSGLATCTLTLMPKPQANEEHLQKLIGLEGRGWTTVYSSWRGEGDSTGGSYCCFAPISHREAALNDPAWDLMLTEGRPGFSQGWRDGEYATWYGRGTPFEALEPLVIHG